MYKNVLFVCLHTTEGRGIRPYSAQVGITASQYAWFKKTLDEHADARWTMVFMHQPAEWKTRKWVEFEKSELVFTDGALRAIAHEAVEHGTGARGLRAICERVLMDVMYDLPEQSGASTVTLRASDVAGETTPEIVAA